ncbi:MAG TPA: hypothetical protein VGF41_02085, partial [Myxococcaceae bacterium]
IYDVDAFERATRGRFPENALLSHDLIEGAFARAGLATDIEVFDDFPSSYLTWTRRKHRWIRGDWQLLRWLTPTVPGPRGPEANPLPLLARWKLLDNLRRSLLELALLAFWIVGWAEFPHAVGRWTVLGVLAVAAPWLVTLLLAALHPPIDKSWRSYYGALGQDALASARQFALALVFLPHQAWISLDAIARTLWRVGVSRRHLLDWQTSWHAEGSRRGRAWRQMWPSPVVACGSAALLIWVLSREQPGPLAPGIIPLGLVVLWLAAPALADALDASPDRRERRLSARVRSDTLRYALLHWRYFERFVSAETHWLAPDNVQETPERVVAMRTSPTNIGLQLLATTSAYDLGFLEVDALVAMLERIFGTMRKLRRFRGHFYNWYDLGSLEDLAPGYVSTVDSGNLAGHLLALRQACLTLPDAPVSDRRVWRAADAALSLAVEAIEAEGRSPAGIQRVRAAVAAAESRLDPSAAIDSVVELLQAADRTLSGGRRTDRSIQDSNEWLAWALALLTRHRETIAGVPVFTIPSRRGATAPGFPSLRERAL